MNAVRLVPGRDGKGAVLQDFVDPVAPHDILVRKCEEKMDEIDAYRRTWKTKQRIAEVGAVRGVVVNVDIKPCIF